MRLESIDKTSHRLNELALSFTECHLLVLYVINLALVLLEELRIALLKHCKSTFLFVMLWVKIAVHLGFYKLSFHLLKLRAEAAEYALHSLFLLLKTSRSSKYCQFFLFHLKRQLVAHLAQLFLEVHLVIDRLLRLVSQQSELLGQKRYLLLLSEVLGDDI